MQIHQGSQCPYRCTHNYKQSGARGPASTTEKNPEGQVWWCILTGFAVAINPILAVQTTHIRREF
jgi:hypothetical protein